MLEPTQRMAGGVEDLGRLPRPRPEHAHYEAVVDRTHGELVRRELIQGRAGAGVGALRALDVDVRDGRFIVITLTPRGAVLEAVGLPQGFHTKLAADRPARSASSITRSTSETGTGANDCLAHGVEQ
jgi:hypothetical protein